MGFQTMQDDDWMIPRHVHGASVSVSKEQHEPHIRVDAELVRQRRLRKERLTPQPTNANAEEPWLDFDRSIARAVPSFPDRMWTLGDTVRWVLERTPEAVDGLSINEEKMFEVLPEIHGALSGGEISGFATTKTDPVPRELPAETWSVYDLVVEEKDGLIRIFPLNTSSVGYEQHLLNLRVKKDDVLGRWPASSDAPTSVRSITTTAAENQCRRWLAAMMKEAPTRPKAKATVRAEALTKFPGLAKRRFDRAWNVAIRETKSQKWGAPGRRS
jgi:hypothetical protein